MKLTSPTIFVTLFWTCAALIAHTYVIYPMLVWCLARALGPVRPPPEIDADHTPVLSLLIAAHNEEAVIEERLKNALALDYPPDRLEIVVASDGSTDRTADIVRGYADRGVRLIEFTERHGKAATLNRAIPQVGGEIVLLSDANTDLDPLAPRRLVRWFQDPAVGVVCGRLVLTDPRTGRNADSLYWRYETTIKQCEARLGALLGANGAIYAIRRSVYTAIPDETIIDDFVIPLLARLRSGCSIVYDTQALANEQTAPDVREEFRRRVRIGAGNFQSIRLLWPLLDPRRGFVAFAFFSHKLLRWFCPFFLIGLMVSSAALIDRPFYQTAFIAQAVLYVIACAAGVAPRGLKLPKLVQLATLFAGMNAALFVGFWRWLCRKGHGSWEPTTRSLT